MRKSRERSRLLLSAALVALIVAADGASALAMNLGGTFRPIGAIHVNTTISRVRPGIAGAANGVNAGIHTNGVNGAIHPNAVNAGTVGAARQIGNLKVGNLNGVETDPCRSSRRTRDRRTELNLSRCGPRVVVNNGDEPSPGEGRHPIHLVTPVIPAAPVVPANPTIVTNPSVVDGGGQPPGTPQQVQRRDGSGVPPANEQRYVPNEVVVELSGNASNQLTNALARRHRLALLQSVQFQLGGTTLTRWRITDRRSVPTVVRGLEGDTSVISAQPNFKFALQDGGAAVPTEGDPAQYILQKMHLPQAHELAKGDRVLVAVIDSGVDVTHPDLAGDIAGTFDAVGNGYKAHSHGTAIAGAIAAHGRLMGAAPAAQILAVRAFSGSDSDDGTSFAIMSGLDWAVSHHARIVNMSFAGPPDPGIARSLAAAHGQGVTLVAAAGNKGAKSPPLYPAADPNVIAVTSTDASDQLPVFANRGRYVAVAAPGVDLMLLAPNGTLQFSSGTSFSAAYVTGTAALMLERKPDLGPDALRQDLSATAHRLPPSPADKDGQSGAGLVDAYQALLSLTPPPAVDAANAMQASAPR